MKTIEFRIKGSRVKADAQGFVGTACEEAMAEVERRLGKVEAVAEKEEYHRTQKQATEQKTGW